MEGIPNLWKGLCQSVLILIIMEDTHGGLMLGFADGTKAS